MDEHSTYGPRYFRLLYSPGFSEELFEAVRKGHAEWISWMQETLRTWETVAHRAKLPKPTYVVGELELSPDGRMISVRLEGDPVTHGALMLFEDGVPLMLYRHIPKELRRSLKVGYENSDYQALNRPALVWQDAIA
jgi:hypothetical protein